MLISLSVILSWTIVCDIFSFRANLEIVNSFKYCTDGWSWLMSVKPFKKFGSESRFFVIDPKTIGYCSSLSRKPQTTVDPFSIDLKWDISSIFDSGVINLENGKSFVDKIVLKRFRSAKR